MIATGRNGALGRTRLTLEHLEQRLLLDGDPELPVFEQFESSEQLEQFLVDDALKRYGDMFGNQAWPWNWYARGGDVAMLEKGVPSPPVADARDYSETNTQVDGVDEADIVKTDGDYIYLLSGSELVIAHAWPAPEMHVESRTTFEGTPIEQYLNGDRLTVISQSYQYDGQIKPWLGGPMRIAGGFWPGPSTTETRVSVFDVTDRSAPDMLSETIFDGSYVSSRSINDRMYLVTQDTFGLPQPEIIPVDPDAEPLPDAKPLPDAEPLPDAVLLAGDLRWMPPIWEDDGSGYVYESQESYLDRIAGQVLMLGLPQQVVLDGDGNVLSSGPVSEATDIFMPLAKDDTNLLTVSVLDVATDTPGPTDSTSVPGNYVTEIYASREALYLLNPEWRWDAVGGPSTSIMKFDFTKEGVELGGVGEVPGRVLNQFSVDEYDGYLRVATTINWGRESANAIYVLEDMGDTLEEVGKVDGLAPGEQIYSARFMGERAFLVTFRLVDPLFAVDMSDPTDPQVAGELKISGFSNYLHPVGEDYILGIGFDADPETGRQLGLQVSLFDVSDLDNPVLADRYSLDTERWVGSEATFDHRAVGYYPEQGILAIPVSNGSNQVWIDRDGDGEGDFWAYRPQSDIWVMEVSPEVGVKPYGIVKFDSRARRTLRIGDLLYGMSDTTIKAQPFSDLKDLQGELYFGPVGVGVAAFEADMLDPDVRRAVASPERSAPQVISVQLGGQEWSEDFNQNLGDGVAYVPGDASNRVLPWSNIDQIKLTFSEDVFVALGDLRISTSDDASPQVIQFEYDAELATAVWTLAEPLPEGTVQLQLGDIVRDTAGSRLDGFARGEGGGDFSFRMSVLPGDANRSGGVDLRDLQLIRNAMLSSVSDETYSATYDFDSNGNIDIRDVQRLRRSLLNQVAATEAPAIEEGAPRRVDLINAREVAAPVTVAPATRRATEADIVFTNSASPMEETSLVSNNADADWHGATDELLALDLWAD